MCEGVIHWKGVIMRDSRHLPPQDRNIPGDWLWLIFGIGLKI